MLAGEQKPIMFPTMEKGRFHNVLLFHFLFLWKKKILCVSLQGIVKHSLAYPPESKYWLNILIRIINKLQ